MAADYDITDIEAAFREWLVGDGVCGRAYSSRPKADPSTAKSSPSSFAVVGVKGEVRDTGAYASCTVSVSLFAKDAGMAANTALLSKMYKALVRSLRDVGGGRYMVGREPALLGDSSDALGYHARTVLLDVTVKATDGA